MRRRFCSCACLLTLGFLTLAPGAASGSTISFPSGTDTSVQVVVNIDTTVAPSGATQSISSVVGTTTSTSISGVSKSGSGSVDLLAGEVKAFGTSNTQFSIITNAWEFIAFDGSGTVDYAFNVDGVLQNSVSDGIVIVEAAVRVYDVTSWTSYFGTTGGQKFTAKDGTGSPFPDQVSSAFDSAGVQGGLADLCDASFITNCTTNQFGTLIPISFDLAGSLDAVAGQIYLLELYLSTYTFGGLGFRAADFADTATFGFTDLGGLNFESASGQFLSQQVPEPATGLMFGIGLAAVGLVRRMRHRAAG